jgi:hypothetical protein
VFGFAYHVALRKVRRARLEHGTISDMRIWGAYAEWDTKNSARYVPDPARDIVRGAPAVLIPTLWCVFQFVGPMTRGHWYVWLDLSVTLVLLLSVGMLTRWRWRRDTARLEAWLGPQWKQISRADRKRLWAGNAWQPPPGRWFPREPAPPYLPPST